MTKPRRRYNFNARQKIHKKYESFKMKAKSQGELNKIVHKRSDLKHAIEKLFSKKALIVAGVGSAVGIGVTSIWNYIESNSGCFKKNPDGSVCKVRELSCCQPEELENITYCDNMNLYHAICDQYDEEQEQSCCKLCDCTQVGCDEQETMQCQRPTVADALTHFAQNVSSGVWSGIETLFPWLSYVVYGVGILFALWILSWVGPFLYRLLPRKRNQDV